MDGLLPTYVGCHDRTGRTVPRRDGTLWPLCRACADDLEAATALLEMYAENEEKAACPSTTPKQKDTP